MLTEGIHLLHDPCNVRLIGGRRYVGAPRTNMQEDQQILVFHACGRQHLLRVEVALPQGLGMPLEALVPGPRTAFRPSLVTVPLKDILHSVASNRLDAQLF